MEESVLYDLLENKFLHLWKYSAEENDDCGFMQKEKELNYYRLEADRLSCG